MSAVATSRKFFTPYEMKMMEEDRRQRKLTEIQISEILESFYNLKEDEREYLTEHLRALEYEEDYISAFCGERVIYLYNQAMDKAAAYLKYGDEF